MLKNLVRDWAAEGAAERAQSHGPLLEVCKLQNFCRECMQETGPGGRIFCSVGTEPSVRQLDLFCMWLHAVDACFVACILRIIEDSWYTDFPLDAYNFVHGLVS